MTAQSHWTPRPGDRCGVYRTEVVDVPEPLRGQAGDVMEYDGPSMTVHVRLDADGCTYRLQREWVFPLEPGEAPPAPPEHEALDALIHMPLSELGELIDATLTRLEILTSIMTAKASQDERRVRALVAEAKEPRAPTRVCGARGICHLPYGHPGDHEDGS